MGYLCPVCEEPFGSDQQCANHLAVTAILHGESHEQWLAEAVEADDWESVPRSDLADIVADRAEEATDHDHPGDHTHPVDGAMQGQSTDLDGLRGGDGLPGASGQPAITNPSEGEGLDADAQAVLREARELTERMQQRGPDGDEGKES